MRNLSEVGFFELLDHEAKPVFFEDIWRGQPTVISLTRHFGCLFCFEQVDHALELRKSLEAAGGKLVIIGNGNPHHARQFMRHFDLKDGVFTDPARRLYRRLSLIHGIRSTLNWTATMNAKRALDAGFRQEGVKGDRWQQGGTFVSNPQGDIVLAHRSQVAGEQVSMEELEKAVRAAAR